MTYIELKSVDLIYKDLQFCSNNHYTFPSVIILCKECNEVNLPAIVWVQVLVTEAHDIILSRLH